MTIGQRIRTKREERGLTQDELAKMLGYKYRSSVNKIETDQQDLPQSKIVAIARALGTTPAYIMGWEDNQSEEQKPEPETIHTIAAHAIRDLTDEDVAEIMKFAKYLKSKYKDK